MAKNQNHCRRMAATAIISNCRGIIDVAVAALARMAGLDEDTALDIVPLFETIADLARWEDEVREMYTHPAYRAHLSRRNRQTVVFGFSDGTKDGGYLQANWSIYEAASVVKLSDEGITVVFFDGRGGRQHAAEYASVLCARTGHREYRNPNDHSGATISSNWNPAPGFNLELL